MEKRSIFISSEIPQYGKRCIRVKIGYNPTGTMNGTKYYRKEFSAEEITQHLEEILPKEDNPYRLAMFEASIDRKVSNLVSAYNPDNFDYDSSDFGQVHENNKLDEICLYAALSKALRSTIRPDSPFSKLFPRKNAKIR